MALDYPPRTGIPLQSNLPIAHPDELPELVHYHDSAMTVYTDFKRVYPVTITVNALIDAALEKMINQGVRLLMVVDETGSMIGLVNADHIMGAKPVQLAEDNQVDHNEITVQMVMKPQSQIQVLELSHLRDAMVGHIVATLSHLQQKHMLVVDSGAVCGLFSASQISRQLGRNILEEEAPAHSLAEMLHTIG